MFVEGPGALALDVDAADDPVAQLDRDAELRGRLLLLREGQDAAGLFGHVVGEQDLSRLRDPSDDARSDGLAVALGEELQVGPGVGREQDLPRGLVHGEEEDVVVGEVALDGFGGEPHDLVRVERGEDQPGDLADHAELGGALPLDVQEAGDDIASVP